MNARSSTDTGPSAHWENYWSHLPAERGAQDAAVTGAARSETFRNLWTDFFREVLIPTKPLKLADLGCGAGVLIDQALKAAGEGSKAPLHLIGVDYAASAASQVQAKNHGGSQIIISGAAADMALLPFSDGAFDMVISQFGAEYAGPGAFREIARMVSRGGVVMCLCHYAGGSIATECADNLAICEAITKSGLLLSGAAIFQEPSRADEALAQYQNALAALRPLADDPAPSSAKDFMIRLADDLGRMVGRRQAYAPRDVLDWIDGMSREVTLYGSRMRAMVNAALSEEAVEKIISAWRDAGLVVVEPAPIVLDQQSAPAAWRLTARRA